MTDLGDGRMIKRLLGVGVHRACAVALLLLGSTALAGMTVLAVRHGQELRGHGAIEVPAVLETAYAGELPRQGRFEANVAYTCYGVSGDGEVSSSVLWDDAWFSQDSFTYNHELARACSVISALAYAESSYYQSGSDTPPYMENALYDLGFDKVETESYRYRSEVVDEVLDVMTQQSDGVAYALAHKDLGESDGVRRELIAVSVRGSYGSEWLSNFNLGEGEAAAAAEALTDERSHDHTGYQIAALDILAHLDEWVDEAESRGSEVSILLTGHSRGGAVAGLLASMLDDRAATRADAGVDTGASGAAADGADAAADATATAATDAADATADATGTDAAAADATATAAADAATDAAALAPRVFAYTFASPRTTLNTRSNDARYGNIFNIVNPADMVTSVPLESWGYVRYGVDKPLPAVDDAGFSELHASMLVAFTELTGQEDAYDPETKLAIDAAVRELSVSVPTSSDLLTPSGVASVAAACALRINPARILLGHYPSVYIAWMEALPSL